MGPVGKDLVAGWPLIFSTLLMLTRIRTRTYVAFRGIDPLEKTMLIRGQSSRVTVVFPTFILDKCSSSFPSSVRPSQLNAVALSHNRSVARCMLPFLTVCCVISTLFSAPGGGS